jgi:hypothetical protein
LALRIGKLEYDGQYYVSVLPNVGHSRTMDWSELPSYLRKCRQRWPHQHIEVRTARHNTPLAAWILKKLLEVTP